MKTLMNGAVKWFLVIALALPALAQETSVDEPELRLNFRGAPLDLVLDYLSEAAGFTVMLETDVSGTVDVWSNQPLTRDEAVDVLNSALNRNGYAAIRDGKKLTVVTKEEAKKRNIPVRSGYNPELIPKNDEIVTQILPVRYINAVQLITDLQPLLPESATMTANEGGNALVITDTQANIRRIAEIIAALDTTVSSVSTVRVFALRYADAKELAETIDDLFEEAASAGNNNDRGRRGGFPGFGRGGRGDDGDQAQNTTGLQAATKVTAVADEHSNSIIVAAPEEYIPMIQDLIASVDTAVQDVTELRVFFLKNADPVEMADILSNLFPNSNSSDNSNRGPGFRFGGGPFGRGGDNNNRNNNNNNDESARAMKQNQVLAVADARTSSIVVSASHDQMEQIAAMIDQLDSSSSRKQKVFVYSLENADVQEVETILRGLFEGENTRNNQNSNQQNNALTTRANNSAQQQGQNTSTFGNNNRGGNGGGFQ